MYNAFAANDEMRRSRAYGGMPPRMSRYSRQVVAVIVFMLAARVIFRNLLTLSHIQDELHGDLDIGIQTFEHVDPEDQHFVDYLSRNLVIRYDVIDNLLPTMNVSIRLTLKNKGQMTIPHTNWQIYFFNFRMIEKHRLEKTGSAVIPEYGIRISHINGGLFCLEPTDAFEPLTPGKELVMSLLSAYYTIGRYDMMPNWYVVAKNAQPRILECTRDEALTYVGPFDNPNKWKRQKEDTFNPYTMEQRYDLNVVEDLGKVGHAVLPTPVSISVSEADKMTLNPKEWVIVSEHGLKYEANLLSDLTQIPVKNDVRMPSKNYIHLQQANVEVKETRQPDSAEAYMLDIDPGNKHILISGTTSAGVFYAIQTLRSLMTSYDLVLPKVMVKDAPRYGYRGLMVDVARNFFNVTEIKKLLDIMAMYKMNRLQLHLTDDEGWRIEIPGLPELTQVGGRRCHDPEETQCIMPCLGSGPQARGLGCGYYKVEDYRDILRYAKTRHIEVIPEIDMPGHSNAAIKSMRARYLRYKHSSPQVAAEFLLHDLQETTPYMSGQMFKSNSINPCMESSYKFVDHVISSLVAMHTDISPLRTFHVGGDEVPADAWGSSVQCLSYARENPELQNIKDLKEHFVRRVIKIAGLSI
jgi:hexosaminidase